MSFVLVDIGCIECGEETSILGIYATLDDGLAAVKEQAVKHKQPASADGRSTGYFNYGQHSIELLEFNEKEKPDA